MKSHDDKLVATVGLLTACVIGVGVLLSVAWLAS